MKSLIISVYIFQTIESDAEGFHLKVTIRKGMGFLVSACCIGLFITSFCVMNDDMENESTSSENSEKSSDSMGG